MSEEGVKLHGMKLSPFVLRVEWALKLKGIEYEYVTEDLKNKSRELLRYNPVHKAVPVLVHHGKPIPESVVILEYIEDAWKDLSPSILPSDPHQRATARFWARYSEECLQGCSDVFRKTGDEQLGAVKELQERFKTLEGYLEGKKFFGGSTVGLVDIVAGWIPFWTSIVEEIIGIKIIDGEQLPLLTAWIHDILELDLVKKNGLPLDEVKALMRNIRENILSAQSA